MVNLNGKLSLCHCLSYPSVCSSAAAGQAFSFLTYCVPHFCLLTEEEDSAGPAEATEVGGPAPTLTFFVCRKLQLVSLPHVLALYICLLAGTLPCLMLLREILGVPCQVSKIIMFVHHVSLKVL